MLTGSSKKRKKLSQEQIKIVARLLAVYFVALLVPLITASIVYLVQIREVEEDILTSRERSLSLNKRIVENAILSIEDTITEIRMDESIAAIGEYQSPLQNRLALRVADEYAESRLAFSMPPYVLEVVVYLKRPDLVLTTRDIYFDTELFYESFLSIEGTSYAEWMRSLRESDYVHSSLEFETISLSGDTQETIRIRSSLPFTTRVEGTGSVTTYVDLRSVEDLLETYLTDNGGFARIELPDGRRLASVGVEAGELPIPSDPLVPQSGTRFVEIEGREYAVTYIRSEANRWLYVSGTPIEVFFAQSARIRTIFIGLIVLLLLVGVPILLTQVFGLSRPIAETSRVLRDGVVVGDGSDSNPFSFISHSVDQLVKRDRALRDLLEEQQPLVRGVILERLFRGEFESHEEARANLVHFGVDVPTDRLGVFCILLEGYYDVATPEIIGEFHLKSALIRDELEHVLPTASLIHNISHDTICVALFVGQDELVLESGRSLDQVIELIARQTRALREVRCTVTAGGIVVDLTQVSVSIDNAIRIAERSAPGAVVARSDEGRRGEAGYFYPTDMELSLVKAIRAGRPRDVRQIAEEIESTNFSARKLSREGVRNLYRELDATRSKLMRRLPTDQRLPFEPEASDTPGRVRELLQHLEMVAALLEDQGAATNALKTSIERFVSENALDQQMGLKLLAHEFNLSEVYLSRIFPDMFGENFHSHIERIRMEQATQLLRTTRLTIEQIADRVGYQSANTFRRVFKRTYGVSPSAYDRA